MLASATDISVSYKAEDRARLKLLVEALEPEGFSLWWDSHISGGRTGTRTFEDSTPAHVRSSSGHSVRSGHRAISLATKRRALEGAAPKTALVIAAIAGAALK